jgi:cysteine desulfurase
MSNPIIYLDNNATTSIAPEVVDAMMPFLSERYGNPSSIHHFGGLVRREIDKARGQVASILGADSEEIIFTSCGSESDNLAIQGFYKLHKNQSKIVTSTVEHPAVKNLCDYLQSEGAQKAEIGVDGQGLLDMDRAQKESIDENSLLSFMWANNETGVLFPIEDLAKLAHEKGALIHTDAVQAVGKIPIDVHRVDIDMLSLSGHKLHAPKGIGVLYIRKGIKLPPLMYGGHQEHSFRPGTENVPYIIGLGKACELSQKHLDDENNRIRHLRDLLERELMARCTGAKLNGDPVKRLPNTLNISFEFIEGEAILLLLDEKGIAASSGSACTTGSLEPSHVMRAMGIPYTFAHSSTRFSLSRYTTEEEIKAVIRELPPIIDRLRAISPYVK